MTGVNVVQSGDNALRGPPPARDIERPAAPRAARHDLACITPATMRGLEIGPLAAPRVRKSEGLVRYLDHADADGLRQKYAADPDMQHRLADIVDVDYVMGENQGIYDAVAHDAPFDYVIASHLIEHIPDPVTWLQDVAKALRVGGVLSLVIPDKRYCFDINRRTSEIGDLVDAHLRGLHQPSYRQVYDFMSKEISGKVDTPAVWAGTADYTGVVRSDVADPDVAAFELCRDMDEAGGFVDVHCHVFTPDSFLELYGTLARLGLIDFEMAYFSPTEVNTLEFFVSLRRLDPKADRRSMMERQLASVIDAIPATVPCEAPADDQRGSPLIMEVSRLERSVITTKRGIVEWVRGTNRRR
jgi:SAM-dependent methyltransferase